MALMEPIKTLIGISSDPLCPERVEPNFLLEKYGAFAAPLAALLSERNGFVAFESALLVLPSRDVTEVPGVETWNHPAGWRRHYDGLGQGCVFFALDAFACGFGITSEGIVHLNPETGKLTSHSDDLKDWAHKLLSNYDYETGWAVAHKWQEQGGQLPVGSRLLPKTPFVLGGAFEADNCVAVPIPLAMEKLGDLYHQIRDVPDGQSVTVHGWIA